MTTRRVHVRLESPVATSFRAQRAADSLDIDTAKKAVHELTIDGVDIRSPFSVGVIVGASGSGKTTLARELYGSDALETILDLTRPVIEQFPASMSYDECAAALAGVGLTSVPCWIRPAVTLSNGQRARAEAAIALTRVNAHQPTCVVIDEWTSVVDRTVAKVMSHCVAKYARKQGPIEGGRIVLVSCHYDVLDWLNPDWVIDCNRAVYLDRRSVQPRFRREEQLRFDIHEVDRTTWKAFSKYHYLSDRLPGGAIECYGLFHGADQVGFQCFANYVPTRKGWAQRIMHSNRTVIHPDYAGLGLGIRVITATASDMVRKGFRVMAKFSSAPVARAMARDPRWRQNEVKRQIGRMNRGGTMERVTGYRENITTYSYNYVGGPALPEWCTLTIDPDAPPVSGLGRSLIATHELGLPLEGADDARQVAGV